MRASLHPALLERLQQLACGPRRLLGIVGPPGSGKSTLAETELVRLGRTARKGAPDTFDAAGYAALLRRVRQQASDEIVYAPDFRREIEEPVAGALPVFPETPLIITEGNYLLLEEGSWASVAAQLDEVWYLQVEPGLRLERLAQRHQRFGRSRDEALAWIASTDEPNARRIEAVRHRAQRQVVWDEAQGLFR
jgi:pantothenate kinase